MSISIYHVDAFTDKVFHGNPAAVCVLSKWLADDVLHKIAMENQLPATTFLVHEKDRYSIRWITPDDELDLCGHGSISAGFVIFNYLEPELEKVNLKSRTELLPVMRKDDYIILDFPVKQIEHTFLPILNEGLGLSPKEVYQHASERCLAVYETEDEIKQLIPNMEILKKLKHRGVIVTAKGKDVDFVSRTFYPKKTFYEDPVTGSSHCLLAPYWSKKLNKEDLQARQLSKRGGDVVCRYENNRLLISGKAVLYMKGLIFL